MKHRVLFLCVHNAARSQLAEGLLRKMAGDRFDVYSAGSEPSHISPYAVRVLHDEGIDASGQYSKSMQQFVSQPFDYVITLCDEEVCPVFPGAAQRLHWGLPDPLAAEGDSFERLQAFRDTADALKQKLAEFVRTVPAAS